MCLVKKANGIWHFTLNYYKLNSVVSLIPAIPDSIKMTGHFLQTEGFWCCSVEHCWFLLQHHPGYTWSKLIFLHVGQIKIYVYSAASRHSELSHDFSSLNRLRHRKDWNLTTGFLVTLHGWHYSWLERLDRIQTALVKWYNMWVTRAEGLTLTRTSGQQCKQYS